jgi:hypothetical protein
MPSTGANEKAHTDEPSLRGDEYLEVVTFVHRGSQVLIDLVLPGLAYLGVGVDKTHQMREPTVMPLCRRSRHGLFVLRSRPSEAISSQHVDGKRMPVPTGLDTALVSPNNDVLYQDRRGKLG